MSDSRKPEDRAAAEPEGEHELLKLARLRMPFGKYKGHLLIDLPEPYLVWFRRTGFPKGSLGRWLEMVYEIKRNGLEYLFNDLKPRGDDAAAPRRYRNEEGSV